MENIILLSSEPTLAPQDTVYQLVNANLTNCSSTNSPCKPDETQISMTDQIIVLILYAITCAVALIGNFLVCQIIFTSRKLKTTTYILIANLAISDILGAISIPSQWLFCSTYILDHFAYGERVCGAMKSIQVQSYYVSTLTMTVIAIDRYQLIATPMKSRMKPKIPIVIIWIIASSFTATTIISMRVSEFFTPHALISCRIAFKIAVPISNFIFRKIRIIILILTQFVIPLTICGILYTKTVIIIWKRSGLGEMTEEQALYMNSSKWKTIKMLIIVVIVFTLSWLPVHAMHFIDFFITPLLPSKCNTSMVYALAYWFGMFIK